jgi:hypothetical protein
VHHAGGIASGQQLVKLCLEQRCGLEASVGGDIAAERAIQRARNMASHRVQGLHSPR